MSLFSCIFLFILYGNFYYLQRLSFSAPQRGSLIPFYALSSWQGIPGLPDLGVVNFFAYVFFWSRFLRLFFFHSPFKRPKRVQLGRCSPRSCSLKQYQSLQLKLLLVTSGLETRFVSAPATFTISSRGGKKYLQVKRNVLKSCLTSGTVLMLTPFSPHTRATSRASFTIPIPPGTCFRNSKSCEEFTDFISSTISRRLANGSISECGKVGECTPPYLVMPLTVEATKPRLCHDERFLNLWVKD